MNAALGYLCCEDDRRATVRTGASGLNGIDYLEVIDTAAPAEQRQRELRVSFLRDPAGLTITAHNVRISGGERIREVPVETIAFAGGGLSVRVAVPGDYSTYTLALVELDGTPLAGLDPLLSAVDFSFKVECPSTFDCRPRCSCPTELPDEPAIDYLAKDYDSFRRLMLDRMTLLAPDWTERSPADLGVALVELVAYLADRLSYEQDAIATEAYLGTARRRVSIRRHATLLDYRMHDGCNARVFVRFVARDAVTLPAATQLLTELPGRAPVLGSLDLPAALSGGPEVFETMHDLTLRPEHDELALYAWGQRECCLPKGATRATLAGHWPDLHAGDLLAFQEVIGPRTGAVADADPSRRHIVRLVAEPETAVDPLFPDPVDAGALQPVTEVTWGVQDALAFSLCLSARTDAEHGRRYVDGVTMAHGNVVLCDHGRTIAAEEALGAPPPPRPAPRRNACGRCGDAEVETVRAAFAPSLAEGPLTHAARVTRTAIVGGRRQRLRVDPDGPAATALAGELSSALPLVSLRDESGGLWLPQHDVLSSDPFAHEFVTEIDDDGRGRVRFGDGVHGAVPATGVAFFARYRIGNGARGNVGAGSIRHVVLDDPGLADAVESLSNPLPARGGVDPEAVERVRLDAPEAFKTLECAVTPEDYALKTQLHPEVQRAQATVRWTGSWRTIYLTVDRTGGRIVDAAFEHDLRAHLERFRMAGQDVEIDGPRFVALELDLEICVQPAYFRADVTAALLQALSDDTRADGSRGHFHPDGLTFGQPVFLSPIVAAAAAVRGVRDVRVVTFQRLGVPSRRSLDDGVLTLGRLEIARLNNDPSFPERGILRLDVRGGR